MLQTVDTPGCPTPALATSQAQSSLESRLWLMESALNNIDVSILITEAPSDGHNPRIVYVNAGFTRLTGYQPEEVIGKTPNILQGPRTDQSVLQRLRHDLHTFQRFSGETINYRKDGSEYLVEWDITPITDSSGTITHWVANQRDVTQRRLEQAVQNQRQKLESLGMLASGISHDFNNLLTAMHGYAMLALQDLPEDSFSHEMITKMLTSFRYASDLTRQLTAYASKGATTMARMNLNNRITEMIGLLRTATGSRIQLIYTPVQGLPEIEIDPTQLQQVLLNLVINAAQAIGDTNGQITISTRLQHMNARERLDLDFVSDSARTHYLALEVTDTGCGMDEATRMRIFDPFFTTKATGNGLGLATLLAIVRRHQGALWVKSTIGQGSCFTVLFPLPYELLALANDR